MKEQQAQELWNKNLREFNNIMRLDSIIIKTILDAVNISSQLEPQISQTNCGQCKHYKKDIEYDKLGSCTNEKIMGDKIILHYCEAFFISEDFGCNKFESKLSG